VSLAVVPELDGVVPAAGQQDVIVVRMIDDREHASAMPVHPVSAVPATAHTIIIIIISTTTTITIITTTTIVIISTTTITISTTTIISSIIFSISCLEKS